MKQFVLDDGDDLQQYSEDELESRGLGTSDMWRSGPRGPPITVTPSSPPPLEPEPEPDFSEYSDPNFKMVTDTMYANRVRCTENVCEIPGT